MYIVNIWEKICIERKTCARRVESGFSTKLTRAHECDDRLGK